MRLDHDEQDPRLGYAEEELVAESVAYTVIAGGLGRDASVAAEAKPIHQSRTGHTGACSCD